MTLKPKRLFDGLRSLLLPAGAALGLSKKHDLESTLLYKAVHPADGQEGSLPQPQQRQDEAASAVPVTKAA